MSGQAASRTPKTNSSTNSTTSSVMMKKEILRRAPVPSRGARRTDFCVDNMNGDSPFLGRDVFFNVSFENVLRGGGITERASERRNLNDTRAHTHTHAPRAAVL